MVSAIKTTEDEHGWLVRGYNTSAKEIQVRLDALETVLQIERANLAEEKIATLLSDEDGRLHLAARGHEIVTVIFKSQSSGRE